MVFLTNLTQNRIVVSAVGDTTCSSNAILTFQNVINEKPNAILFLGDSSYEYNAECFTYLFESFKGLKEKTIFSRCIHDDKESESDTVKEQLERYFEITEWTNTKQEGNEMYT